MIQKQSKCLNDPHKPHEMDTLVGLAQPWVWDKVASERARKEEWSGRRKRCQTAEDKRDFISQRTDQESPTKRNLAKKGKNQGKW